MCDLEVSKQEASSKGEKGDIKKGGEGDAEDGGVGQNGSLKGRSRWSQVVRRVRLAGGARLEKKGFVFQHPDPRNFSTGSKFYIIGPGILRPYISDL